VHERTCRLRTKRFATICRTEVLRPQVVERATALNMKSIQRATFHRRPVATKWLRGFNKSTGFAVQPDPLLALRENPYSRPMSPLQARVENGRLVLDEPTTLPEGRVVDVVADDEGDGLTDEERRALHEALSASWKSAESGRLRPASEILDQLRRNR